MLQHAVGFALEDVACTLHGCSGSMGSAHA